jgi:hypothetical protein
MCLSKLVYIVLLLDTHWTALKVSSAIFYPLNSNAGFRVGSTAVGERQLTNAPQQATPILWGTPAIMNNQ